MAPKKKFTLTPRRDVTAEIADDIAAMRANKFTGTLTYRVEMLHGKARDLWLESRRRGAIALLDTSVKICHDDDIIHPNRQ